MIAWYTAGHTYWLCDITGNLTLWTKICRLSHNPWQYFSGLLRFYIWGNQKNAIVVPQLTSGMYVPQELKRSSERLRAFTKLVKMERRRTLVNAVVINNNSSAICSRIDGFHSQRMARPWSDEVSSMKSNLCVKIQWEPDVLHNVRSTFKDT